MSLCLNYNYVAWILQNPRKIFKNIITLPTTVPIVSPFLPVRLLAAIAIGAVEAVAAAVL